MKKFYFMMMITLLIVGCAGNATHFYNRENWSFRQTEKLFKDVLILTDQAMILDKVKPKVPKNKQIMGKAEVKVRVDEDGKVQAVMIKKNIEGMSKELVRAAKLSKYKKYETNQGNTRHYVLIVEYRF
ncbi:hypothetical protein JXJ21_10210 [candidate division KSB1 bacterium]|nr:hypothetical protein [candidate division KSB1 bacterium]